MMAKKADSNYGPFAQTQDETGRTRLDRPFSGEEAAEQDAEHRRILEENRKLRFRRPAQP